MAALKLRIDHVIVHQVTVGIITPIGFAQLKLDVSFRLARIWSHSVQVGFQLWLLIQCEDWNYRLNVALMTNRLPIDWLANLIWQVGLISVGIPDVQLAE